MASNSGDSRKTVEYGDQQVERGSGGETHQVAGEGRPSLTTQQGVVVANDQNTLRVGELFQATGLDKLMDGGFIEVGNGTNDAAGFLSACKKLRYWEREASS